MWYSQSIIEWKIHNLNQKKLKTIYSINKKRNKPKVVFFFHHKCQIPRHRTLNPRTKRVYIINSITLHVAYSHWPLITKKSHKQPKTTWKITNSKWVWCILNWMKAFGTHFDMSWSSKLINGGWFWNLGKFQINFKLISG